MPNRYYLNTLDEAGGQLPTLTAGEWSVDKDQGDFLDRYAASILVSGKLTDTHLSHSVPSAYSRPIQFYQAFANSKHPLHEAVVSEWRGLMGLVALQQPAGLTLTVKEYNVPALEAQTDADLAAGVGGSADHHIATILRNQIPYPPEDWERWWTIYCDSQMIGATSPWTIGYTAAEYRCPKSIAWQTADGLLQDPIRFYDPEKTKRPSWELSVLMRWVELVLDGGTWGMTGLLEKQAGALRRELEAWKTELSSYRTGDASVKALARTFLVPEQSRACYKYFLRKPVIDAGAATPDSQLMLKTREGAAPVIVLKRNGLESTKRVWGSIFAEQVDLNNLAVSGPAGWKAKTGAAVGMGYVIAEDVFLPPILVELKGSEHSMDRGAPEYALPLTPKFFSYIDYAELAESPEMLEVQQTQGSVIVRLRLPLEGGGTLDVEKTYDKQKDVEKVTGPTPGFAVWPDFQAPDWKYNYAICATPPNTNIVAAPLLSAGQELWPSPNVDKKGNVRTWPAPHADGVIAKQQPDLRIWPLNHPAIGFVVYARHKVAGSESTLCAGVVLRDEMGSPPTPNANITRIAGVDFGTSSTHVMIDQATGRGPAVFNGRVRLLTAAEASMKELVVAGLYPEDIGKLPLVTLLAVRRTSIVSEMAPNTEYSPRFLFYPNSSDAFLADVKWGAGGSKEGLPLRAYLRDIAHLIAAEARASGVAHLVFRWSFPLSMPSGLREGMEDFWSSTAEELSQTGGLSVTAEPGITESDAMRRCLATITPPLLNVMAGGLSVGVDIGGGSSDIVYWSASELKDQISLKLAGNDLLPRLWNLPHFVARLTEICKKEPFDQRWAGKFESRRAIYINSMLTAAQSADGNPRQHGFVSQLREMAEGESPWLEARSLIYLFFCGLSFYIGLHARHADPKASVVQVYFGGRGASLLAWVTGNPRSTTDLLGQAVGEGFARENDNKTAQVEVLSPTIVFNSALPPKEEVVRGLLAQGDWVQPSADQLDGKHVMPVEVGWFSKENKENAVPWDKPLDAAGLAGLSAPTNLNSTYLSHLMDILIPKHIAKLSLDPRLKEVWESRNKFPTQIEEYIRRAARNPGQGILEPVFAAELKTVIDRYVEMVTGTALVGTAPEKKSVAAT